MSGRSEVAAAVAELFDAASPVEAASLDGIVTALERTRGRRIVIDDIDDLPPGVCGRWGWSPSEDVLQLRRGVLSRSWTVAHELGHMVLGHRGQPVAAALAADLSVASLPLVEYMLNRGGAAGGADRRQEADAEAFAGLLMARLRQAARSAAPNVQARLNDTLG